MPQALLIGGPRSRMKTEVGVRPVDTIVLTSDEQEHRYWYVGNLQLLRGERVWVYRHESIDPQDIESSVEIAHVEVTRPLRRDTGHANGLQAPAAA